MFLLLYQICINDYPIQQKSADPFGIRACAQYVIFYELTQAVA